MLHPSSHPRDATIPLTIELPVSHLKRLHILLDRDHSLSMEQIIQSALLLYLAYKLPDFCCRPSLFFADYDPFSFNNRPDTNI